MTLASIPTPLWILYACFALLSLAMSISTIFILEKKRNFTLKYFKIICIYLFELTLIYLAYRYLITHRPLGNPEYTSKDVLLQQFAVFFSAYQIFVLIILKIYDSLHKDAYCAIIAAVEKVQAYVEEGKIVPQSMFSEMNFTIRQHELPRKAHEYYTDLLKQIEIYNTNLENTQDTKTDFPEIDEKIKEYKELVSDVKIAIQHIKIDASTSKEATEFHWNISLLLRLFKRVFKWMF